MWAFAGGSPRSYVSVCWNRLLAGTGAADVKAAEGARVIFQGGVSVLPLKGSSAVLWLSEQLVTSFWGNGQFCYRATTAFSDPLHHQEDEQGPGMYHQYQ